MYWCKPRVVFYALCLLAFYGCKPDVKETKAQYTYFDLKGFMHKDSARLVAANPFVDKTVSHNGTVEHRKLKISSWGNELSLFTNSDINRPAWRSSYKTATLGDSLVYTAGEPELKTRKLIVVKHGDVVKSIHIINRTKNLLFEASEDLTYIPDSSYVIDKRQKVLFLGRNNYLIRGKLVK